MGNEKVRQLDSYLSNMDTLFKGLYETFQKQKLLKRGELKAIPGIYVFYNGTEPIYVGRADNIKLRIQYHTRPSSGSQSATFAFNLAKLEFDEKIKESKLGREDIMKLEGFSERFTKHKEDLHASSIRCIEIKNDIIQTMFEPYLALKLGTYPHNNTFENH